MPTDKSVVMLSDKDLADIEEAFPNWEYNESDENPVVCQVCSGAVDDHKANCVVPTIHALCQTVRALKQALRDHGQHESHCKSNERYPSPACDCVLARYLDHKGE